jgi:iron complex outermembrane receptor protein
MCRASWACSTRSRATANLYATVSRGYKGPQIDNDTPVNAAAASGSFAGYIVKPELPTSVELGTKLSFLERRLDVDLAAFHTKIKDFQEQNCTLTAVGALSCIPLNVPSVTSKGLEADIRARPLPQLQLGLSLAMILDTAYPAGFSFDNSNVGGQRLLYSPRNKVALNGDYSWDLPGDYELKLGGDMVYKSRVRYCNSLDPECSVGGHSIASLRLALRSPDDKWGVECTTATWATSAYRTPSSTRCPARAPVRASPTAWARTRSAASA